MEANINKPNKLANFDDVEKEDFDDYKFDDDDFQKKPAEKSKTKEDDKFTPNHKDNKNKLSLGITKKNDIEDNYLDDYDDSNNNFGDKYANDPKKSKPSMRGMDEQIDFDNSNDIPEDFDEDSKGKLADTGKKLPELNK